MLIVFALNGDSPTRRENVLVVVSIDRLEIQTAEDRRDGQVMAVGQMHNGWWCHGWVVCVSGSWMVCTRLMDLMLLTNDHHNGFDS
jgi:hypothetical protein